MALTFRQEIFRKMVHLSSFWIVLLIYFAPVFWNIIIFSCLTLVSLATEYESKKHSSSFISYCYKRLFSQILRDPEKNSFCHLSGAPYIFAAALICVIFYSRYVAMFAMTILFICDAVAALVGKKYGHKRLVGHKTREGTLAFIVSGILIALIFNISFDISLYKMVWGVLLASLGELFNKHIHLDDNLSIPILSGLPFLF